MGQSPKQIKLIGWDKVPTIMGQSPNPILRNLTLGQIVGIIM